MILVNRHWNAYHFRLHLIKRFQNEGYRVAVIGAPDAYTPALIESGADVYSWRLGQHSSNILKESMALVRLIVLLLRIRPGLLLTFTPKGNLYGGIAGVFLRCPQIITVTGLGTLFLKSSPLLKAYALCARIFWRKAFLVFQNGDDRNVLIALGVASENRWKVVFGSGVDHLTYSPAIRAIAPKSGDSRLFSFVYIGRLVRTKGVLDLISASIKLSSPNEQICGVKLPPFRVCFFGAISETDSTSLSAQELQEFSKNTIFEFRGYAEDPRSIYRDADCVILPSHREGFPRCLAESASIGIPMLASDVAGCRAIVEDGVNGYLFKVGDINSIADAMLKMLCLNDSARNQFSAAALERSKNYRSELIAAEYSALVSQNFKCTIASNSSRG